MASPFYHRLAWLPALKGAIAAAVTCWIVGLGWPATLVFVSIGSMSAAFFARRKAGQQLDVFHDALYAGSTPGSSVRYGMFPNYRDSRSRFALFWEVVSHGMPLGPFQRFAVLAFSAQTAISLLLISAFWIASICGWAPDIHLSRLEGLLEQSFGISAANAHGKAVFDALFVPLSLLFIIPLMSLVAALVRSAGALIRDPGKYKMVLLGTLGYLAFFVLALVPSKETSLHLSSLARFIINGNVLGYIVCFCFLPLFGLLLSAELPEKSRD